MHTYIRDAAARVLFVSAWARREEDRGRFHSGDLMHILEKKQTPQEAIDAADSLVVLMEEENGESIEDLLVRAADADGDDSLADDAGYAEEFGHYLAMMALGEEVSWFDDHKKFKLKVPSVELELDEATENPAYLSKIPDAELKGYLLRYAKKMKQHVASPRNLQNVEHEYADVVEEAARRGMHVNPDLRKYACAVAPVNDQEVAFDAAFAARAYANDLSRRKRPKASATEIDSAYAEADRLMAIFKAGE